MGIMSSKESELIPDAVVARQRYGVHPITLTRWDRSAELGFPSPVEINGRFYRRRSELERWERSRVVARAGKQ
jgi:hypothetical protein